MSKFFKALEQAEREQALRGQPQQPEEGRFEVMALLPGTELEEAAGSASPPPAEGVPPLPATDWLAEPFRAPEPGPAPGPPADVPDGIDPHLVSLLTPTSFEAEQYRTLRHLVERLHKDAGLSLIAVSSPTVGDGKTITAINLAGALAQAPEARVLLVDADLRRPSLPRYLGLDGASEHGLVDAILDPALSLQRVVRPCPPFNLTLLPSGRPPAASYEVLKSPRLGELLEEARQRYDYVVLDTPPLLPYPDCRLIGKWIDGFLVITAAHKTPRKLVEEALAVVDPAKMLGLVFNRDNRPVSGYYSGGSSNGDWMRRLTRPLHSAWSQGQRA